MGDAVNLASRLQSAARPMTVLVSEHTYNFVAPVFNCIDRGAIEVKGKAEPVHAYEVLERKAEPGRVRGLAGLESRLVGRDADLAVLLQLSDAVRAGLGRGALVIGEPGLGKSRLISEWRARSQVEPAEGGAQNTGGVAGTAPEASIQWVEGRCLTYGQGLAYHLLLDLLRSILGVPTAAGEAEVRKALMGLTEELFGPSALDVYAYLGHMLSLQLEDEALEMVRMLDPQALQTRYLDALERLLRALAARRPVAVVLDDIHWADPSSVELLGRLLPLALEVPLLFCLVTRPDQDAPGWKLVVRAREVMGTGLGEVVLNPLSEGDSHQLVTNLLEVESLPGRVRTAILEKAEGNPFFVEEVIRMLIDHGAIISTGESWVVGKELETVDIPDTLHGLLLARIDRLPDEAKYTLRVAAVIGRQFPVKVLEQVLRRGSA
jgi:predicted ATPase